MVAPAQKTIFGQMKPQRITQSLEAPLQQAGIFNHVLGRFRYIVLILTVCVFSSAKCTAAPALSLEDLSNWINHREACLVQLGQLLVTDTARAMEVFLKCYDGWSEPRLVDPSRKRQAENCSLSEVLRRFTREQMETMYAVLAHKKIQLTETQTVLLRMGTASWYSDGPEGRARHIHELVNNGPLTTSDLETLQKRLGMKL